jgi:hypothetical protein
MTALTAGTVFDVSKIVGIIQSMEYTLLEETSFNYMMTMQQHNVVQYYLVLLNVKDCVVTLCLVVNRNNGFAVIASVISLYHYAIDDIADAT